MPRLLLLNRDSVLERHTYISPWSPTYNVHWTYNTASLSLCFFSNGSLEDQTWRESPGWPSHRDGSRTPRGKPSGLCRPLQSVGLSWRRKNIISRDETDSSIYNKINFPSPLFPILLQMVKTCSGPQRIPWRTLWEGRRSCSPRPWWGRHWKWPRRWKCWRGSRGGPSCPPECSPSSWAWGGPKHWPPTQWVCRLWLKKD